MGAVCRFNYRWMYLIADSPQYDNEGNRKTRETGTCPPVSGRWPVGRSFCAQYWNLRIWPEADSYVSALVGQFFEVTQYGVRTAGTNKRMEELMSHEVSRDILNTWTATKIYAHQRTQDFTVLIAILCASQSSCGIYGWCPKSIQLLHDGKNPPKGVRYSDFLYFYHVIQIFCLFVLRH